MKLRKVRILGFQSFSDSGEIEFSDEINLIIGQNNSGKSALLRALQSQIPDDRHRTPDRWAQYELPRPEVHMSLEISGKELKNGILRIGNQQMVPVPTGIGPQQFADMLWSHRNIEFQLIRLPDRTIKSQLYPSHQLFDRSQENQSRVTTLTPENGTIVASGIAISNDDSLPTLVDHIWEKDMFFFSAERMTVGESAYEFSDRLLPNARNLPAVLLNLIGNRGDVFLRLVKHVREVFSTVGNISVAPLRNSIEIRIWPTEAMERVELSFPLNFSGTGVAQVIAILTTIMTFDDAVIIVDEISSFLHPAAVKTLLRIIQTEYSSHQYIISTHAPEVIAFSGARTVHLVKREGYKSSISPLSLMEIGKFREVAEHLGVSMGDVFAAERIVWVEGPTEELIFPYVYQKLGGYSLPRGTMFTSVAATGDFNRKRDRAIVYEVYSRLSQASATLVVAVVFSFDTEELCDADKAGMIRNSGNRLHFLPRRHIECYLLDATAIAEMIVAKDPQSEHVANFANVSAALIELAGDRRFFIKEWYGDLNNQAWIAKVDAAGLIACVTEMISDQRATFNKKEDSLGLLKNILERSPEQLQPLYEYVRDLVTAITIGH